ncbi:MAG: hydrolase 1, exosortase A system-associated [Novosphingobium sp.]
MSRRHVLFECEGTRLAGTLDDAPGETGLLIVTGGNEVRSGAWSGQAQMATRIAAAGYPVFRFDRRGTGDSEGPNGEFRSSAPDIAAALTAFREHAPQLTRVAALGNCDAASALMLAGGAGFDALILSNPWTIEEADAAPPPEALRAHYRQRLGDWSAIRRLLTGQVSLRKLLRSLLGAAGPAAAPSGLAQDMAAGIAAFGGTVRFLVADRDRTAQAFLAAWDRKDARIRHCPDSTHSYVESHARDWLVEQVLVVLRS